MTIYIFGNPLLDKDAVAPSLVKPLSKSFPQITFKISDPNEDFPPPGVRHPIILDAVKGLREVSILRFRDLKSLEKSPVSPHDYDLLMHLSLLKKMDRIDEITIIGIPYGTNIKNITGKVNQAISSLL